MKSKSIFRRNTLSSAKFVHQVIGTELVYHAGACGGSSSLAKMDDHSEGPLSVATSLWRRLGVYRPSLNFDAWSPSELYVLTSPHTTFLVSLDPEPFDSSDIVLVLGSQIPSPKVSNPADPNGPCANPKRRFVAVVCIL
jgi:hypothetical protein